LKVKTITEGGRRGRGSEKEREREEK